MCYNEIAAKLASKGEVACGKGPRHKGGPEEFELPSPTDLIPIPPKAHLNTGRKSARLLTHSKLFGVPTGLVQYECRNEKCTNEFLTSARLHDKWPAIKIYSPFGAILSHGLAAFKQEFPQTYPLLVNAGSLCVRLVRVPHPTTTPSDHSWATAIDIGVGTIDRQGDGKCQYGLLELYSVLKRYGLFWGATYQTEDSMHFGMSDELLNSIKPVKVEPHDHTPYHELWSWSVNSRGWLVPSPK